MRPLTTRSLARLRTGRLLPNSLRFLWLLGVLWCELGSYKYAVWICGWPDSRLKGSSANATHVLILTDPQVRHPTILKHVRLFPSLHDWFYHAGLRRSWRYVNNLRPDVVIFLGDMLAAGRKIKSDDEYVENYAKFRSIFAIDRGVPVFHVPGNEDVGLNLHAEDAVHAQRRYSTHFGPLNSEVSISNHSFVFVNAPGLVEEDYQRARHHQEYEDFNAPEGGATEFIRSLALWEDGAIREPTILFTHIPLSRPDNAGCGPLRERGSIRRGAGPGYQNTFGPRTSEFLLQSVKPARVFSGDDRDYCEYTHSRSATDAAGNVLVREVTVKSFSPDKNIRRPGFHLLSLVPPAPGSVDPGPGGELPSLADRACLLPSQERMYSRFYLPFAMLTLLVLIIRRAQEHRTRPHHSPLPSYSPETAPHHTEPSLRRKPAGTYDEVLHWYRGKLSSLFGGPRDDYWMQRKSRTPLKVGLTKGFKSFVEVPPSGASLRWTLSRLTVLVLFDFVRVVWPAFVLWATAMWYTG